MRFPFIEAEKANFPVAALCRMMRVTRGGFYAWRKRGEPKRAKETRRLTAKIRASHAASGGAYGSPRILGDLVADGEKVSRKRIAKIMKAEKIDGVPKKKFKATTDSDHTLPIAPDLLQRNFEAEAPDEVWVADITAIPTWEGWLYLAAVVDLFSRRVVGWAIADHMRAELALEALEMALRIRQPDGGLIHHSDRGSQYASAAYRAALEAAGALASMSRKGDCWDNAVAESFFGSFKRELINRRAWPTQAAAIAATQWYISNFYNLRRRHSTLGNTSPVVYEQVARQLEHAA